MVACLSGACHVEVADQRGISLLDNSFEHVFGLGEHDCQSEVRIVGLAVFDRCVASLDALGALGSRSDSKLDQQLFVPLGGVGSVSRDRTIRNAVRHPSGDGFQQIEVGCLYDRIEVLGVDLRPRLLPVVVVDDVGDVVSTANPSRLAGRAHLAVLSASFALSALALVVALARIAPAVATALAVVVRMVAIFAAVTRILAARAAALADRLLAVTATRAISGRLVALPAKFHFLG